MVEKIVMDCDPGHDDALALIVAAGSPEIDLLALTTVAGNQVLAKVTRNALVVREIAGIGHVPVAAGADRPLVRPLRVADDVHGETGLDGPHLPEPIGAVDPRHAVDLLADTLVAHPPGTVTVVATGPLTNIALLARRAPALVARVKRVVLMGGGVHVGNLTAVAEFNIAVDPEAAAIVFAAGWHVTMVGLDVTHQALATPAVRAAVGAVDTAPARFVEDLLRFFAAAYREAQGFPDPPVHDPCAIVQVIAPDIVRATPVPLAVELAGALTTGMTVADLRAPAPPNCPTAAALEIDATRFWDVVVDALGRLGDPTAPTPGDPR